MENQASKTDDSPSGRSDQRTVLFEKAKDTTTDPGVYLMKDPQGQVLYVGKAKNLRNRLSSYFQPVLHEIPRTEILVRTIDHFDVILTETETEALVLENSLIKRYKPKYNIRLKDDKTYPYLKVQLNDDFPKIEWTRKVRRDGARYFGPFPSAWAARQVMSLLTEHFQLRDCSENTFRHRSRPCLLYQMQKCTAPCVGKISAEDYRAQVRDVVKVLEGKGTSYVKGLRKQMSAAAEEENYEQAAMIRDQIRNIEVVTATQSVDQGQESLNQDVVEIAREGLAAQAVILQVRSGRLLAVKHFHLQNSDPSQSDAEVLAEVLTQYLMESGAIGQDPEMPVQIEEGGEVQKPGFTAARHILVRERPSEIDGLERSLGVEIVIPRTNTEKQLLQVAETNVRYALEHSLKAKQGEGIQSLEEVQEKLELQRLPRRIECYDISNFQGEDSVASRVVFIDGAADKNLYRRYKIKTVEGQNDFAMMKEVLGRRFAHVDEDLPDLVVVDGGRGQLSQAVAILDELGVQGIGVVGLAKARTESDFQAKEVKSSMERIILPNRKNPVKLAPNTGAYRLLTQVRDEAHRFAISYHRLLRDKRSIGGR